MVVGALILIGGILFRFFLRRPVDEDDFELDTDGSRRKIRHEGGI